MQGIMGVTGMLLQQIKPKDQTDNNLVDSLKLIMASSGLLLNLINNLLDVKKVNSESELIVLVRSVFIFCHSRCCVYLVMYIS
jgi:signal transduction histidine kinase